VSELSAFDAEMALGKLKWHKSSVIDQILAELIKAGGRTIRSQICELINSICHTEEMPEEYKSAIVHIDKKGEINRL